MPEGPTVDCADATTPAPRTPALPDTVLAFDVGSVRTGVAVGQRFTGDGRGLCVVGHASHALALAAIAPLIEQWRPQALLVGQPLTLEGAAQPASDRARGFARALVRRFGLPVIEIDERHSSQAAAERFASGRRSGLKRRNDADRIDADAAAVLIGQFYAEPGEYIAATSKVTP